MKKNIGSPDRIIRLIIAVLLLLYAWVYSSFIALGFALFTLYEVCASWCVIYHLLGKNSCPLNKKK